MQHHLGAGVSHNANFKMWLEKHIWVAFTMQFPAFPSHYFNLLFNVVEFVGPRGVEVHTHGVTDQNL